MRFLKLSYAFRKSHIPKIKFEAEAVCFLILNPVFSWEADPERLAIQLHSGGRGGVSRSVALPISA